MISQTTVRFTFPATHVIFDPRCPARGHGHQWTLGVTFTMNPGKDGFPDLPYEPIRRLVDELRDETLNEMLFGAIPTPEGFAGWVLERFRMEPGITAVTIDMDHHSASLSV